MESIRKQTLIAGLALAILAGSVQTSQAGLLDWLFPRRAYYKCAAAQCAAGACPTTVNYAPAADCGACTQTCMVPQTRFRTTFKPVPVTTYRPVTTADPCTGCQVTCMKPCTSYRMQLQRVPVTTFHPVTTPVAAGCNTCAAPVVAEQAVQYNPVTQYAPAAAPTSPGCSSCASNQYAPSTQYVPNTQYAPTTQMAPGGQFAPSTQMVPGGGAGQYNPAPADLQPSLRPETRMVPQDQATELQYRTMPVTPVTPLAPSAESSSYNSTLRRLPPTTLDQNSETQPLLESPVRTHRITPVPDPDASSPRVQPMPPRLLNPNDQTAYRNIRNALRDTTLTAPVRPAVMRVVAEQPALLDAGWESTQTTPAMQLQPATRPAPPQEEKWDDSGWETMRW